METSQALLTKIQNSVSEKDLKAALCKASFYHFVIYFWDTIISEKAIWNWHIKTLCDLLQPHILRAINGQPKKSDIVVNISPGTTKSTIISQMLPAYVWAVKNEAIILTSTNSDKLTAKNAMRSKDIITSEKYKELFPEVVIRKDASAKTFYQNTKGGARFSFTTKGSKIGNHGDILIEDDPTTAKQAKSKVEMEAATEGFKEFQTRKTNKENSLYILLMQRLSPNDYTTLALSKLTNVLHICLPAIDSNLVKPSYLREKYINGLLDPVRLSESVLKQEKRALNSDEDGTSEDDFDAQFLQDPKTKEGKIYDLKYYDEITNEDGAVSIACGDMSDAGIDYTCVVFAKIIGKNIFIHDVVYTQQPSDPTSSAIALRTLTHNCSRTVIETNNMGHTYISLLKNKGTLGLKGILSKGNKMNRIVANSYIVNQFLFKREGSKEYNKFIYRLERILKTDTKEDDCADAVSILAQYIFSNYRHLIK